MAIIQKLGLRFQPVSQDALDDHRGKITLLISDVDGLIPPDVLERICAAWVLKSPYMPKASDLFEAARGAQSKTGLSTREDWEAVAEARNQIEPRSDIRWVARPGGGTYLELKYEHTLRAKRDRAERNAPRQHTPAA